MHAGLNLTLNVGRPAACTIVLARGALQNLAEILAGTTVRRAIWVADQTVQAAVGNLVDAALRRAFGSVDVITIEPGEQGKTLAGFAFLLGELERLNADRLTTIVAVGGGSTTDSVGFAASAYLRGIPYICVPTTLTGQVDAAVGGKVAVNTTAAKNAVGAFYHPSHVIIDPALLPAHLEIPFRDGLAEIVKVATISDGPLFEKLEDLAADQVPTEQVLDELVRRAVMAKLALLTKDPFETELDRLLNFGHETAHALEKALGHAIRHGPAVAIGIAAATRISVKRALLGEPEGCRVLAVLERLSLPVSIDLRKSAEQRFVDALRQVMLVRAGHLRVVLPTGIGHGVIAPAVTIEDLTTSIRGS
ncbi:3-dehydroquinate synthase [Kribbella catacumbae]|uniref:3-dehydroquinate synthase n=1 Tax=Kribbella catacumbae TaxID=460086 RepID=UPI00036DC2C9|nr:3-dehydroquinate synthase family protein [Kribbella catacumbae]